MPSRPRLGSLVLASANPGKLREFKALLAGQVGQLQDLATLGIAPAAEPHATFVENALAKARAAAAAARTPALADDSGICVSCLDGRPGVHSARFADGRGDKANNELLLRLLRDRADRRAHYHCSLVLCRHADDPSPLIAEGRWHGTIAAREQGVNGFGYDTLFIPAGSATTAAQWEPADKDAVSHRGRAVRLLLELLGQEL